MARKLIVEVILDTVTYTRQIQKAQAQTTAFSRNVERGTTGATAGFVGLGKGAGIATAAIIGAQGLTTAIRASFGEMANAQKVSAQTAAVLESTGGAAGVTAKQVDDLAQSLMNLSGVDDEAIQSAENLLLTFTRIHRETFPAATKAALDMSVALGEDLRTAALQVGKALQDPVRGITALRRAGVNFSDDQRTLIARLVATGQTAKAQQVILEELNKEFGKSAEAAGQTLPGQLNILQQNMLNLGGAIAGTVTPALTGFVGALNQMFENIRNNSNTLDNFLRKWGLLESGKLPFRRAPTGTGPGPTGPVGGPATGNNYFAGPTGPLLPQLTVADLARIERQKQLRNQWFDAIIGRRELRAGLLSGAAAQLAAYKAISATLTARIAATKDITRKLRLEDEQLQVAATVAGLQAQIAADLKQKQLDAAQKAKEAAEKIRQQVEAAKQERLGWLDFAIERAGVTKTIKDDLAAYRAKERFLQGLIKREGRTLELVSELWRVRQQIKDLNKKNVDADPLAGLFQVSSRQLANILAVGTGLGAAGRRRLGFNIAGAEIQPVHMHVNIDGREVASVVTKQQTRSGNRTARQTSGRRG